MKKAIYSIVTALILSVLFALFVPRLLFQGDARWTYQNDAARMDVHFSGRLKNGRVGAEGADLRVTQPAWLSNENYQGTVIEVPVSYRNKTCQIKLTPQAEEWGEDVSLVIELKGKDLWHRGKRRPAWVCFQNITLNGEPIAGDKKVWHNKPFFLKYPLHSSSEIVLTFDICKPFAASDIAFKHLIAAFFACLVLSLLFVFPQAGEIHIPEFVHKKDIVEVLPKCYKRIDPVYRRSFWIIFGVLCCAFGCHMIWFMLGNHDWRLLDSTHRWNAHAYEGRYMVFAVKALLSRGIYLPLVHDIISFATLALNAVLLCRYWRLEKRVIYYVFCGLVLTAQPFTLSMMYFVNMTPEVFIGVTCALVALLLSEKIAIMEGSLTMKLVYSLVAIVLVNFALAMYPVIMNTIAVAFVGRLLVQSFDWDGSFLRLKSSVRPYMLSAFNIVLGTALYKLVITFVFPAISLYNTRTLPLEQVPERLGVLLKQSFHQLYEYDMPFLHQWILWVFLGYTVILVLHVCCTGNLKQKTVRLILLFGALFATQTVMIIAKLHMISGRIELFGLVFFEVLVMVLFITRFRKLHNFSVIIGACIISASVLSDLDCLRTWKLGFDAEKMLWNRVLARLEIQKDFDPKPSRKYDIVQIGGSISMRQRYYGKPLINDMDNGSILFGAYDFSHSPFSAHQFYYPTFFRGKPFARVMLSDAAKAGYEARLRRLYQAGVLQKAEVWPKPNGLMVWKNIILFVTDGKELENYRKKFERELGEK